MDPSHKSQVGGGFQSQKPREQSRDRARFTLWANRSQEGMSGKTKPELRGAAVVQP